MKKHKKVNSGGRYRHIKKAERLEISILLKKKYNLREIARALKRSPGTISDEIKKNKVKSVYDPDKANHKAYTRRLHSKYQSMKIVSDETLRNYIETKLSEDWSPEEISGRIKEVDKHVKYISPKGIYKYVYSAYGELLEKHLRYNGKRKKRKYTKVSKLKDRIFIDKRPKIVENRRRFGDWEGDFIVSGKSGHGVLLVLHERKSRYALIKKIDSVNIETVHRYIFELTGGVILNTLTLDNDIVFRKHKELSQIIGAPVYFCHPYHSWEKGGVENTNKLIRQYVPKSSDISKYTNQYIQIIQNKLNNRPRKCLSYETPLEVMTKNKQLKIEIDKIIHCNFSEKLQKEKAFDRLGVFGLRG